jgi:hypothetical protein
MSADPISNVDGPISKQAPRRHGVGPEELRHVVAPMVCVHLTFFVSVLVACFVVNFRLFILIYLFRGEYKISRCGHLNISK